MRLLGLLRPWCMVPVFLLGVLVAVVKLAGMADVSPGIGLAGFGLLTVLLTILGRLSPHVIWRYAETAGVVPVHVPRAGPDSVLTGCHVCGQVRRCRAMAIPRPTITACAAMRWSTTASRIIGRAAGRCCWPPWCSTFPPTCCR